MGTQEPMVNIDPAALQWLKSYPVFVFLHQSFETIMLTPQYCQIVDQSYHLYNMHI